MTHDTPDLHLLDDVVAERILGAMRAASEALTRVGVQHALCGGLAVGAHGFPRATKGVDFLVGDEAFDVHSGGIVSMRPGVPIQVNGVAVDHLSAAASEPFLAEALDSAPLSAGIRVVAAEVLVYMKLKSPRFSDRVDIIRLVQAGLDVGTCERWLDAHAPQLLDRFRVAVADARAEE